MNKKDYYEVLGVEKNANLSEIKKQFKKLAKEYHPDKQINDEDKIKSEEKFKEINEAYNVLSDENKRKQYDRFGHNNPANQGFKTNYYSYGVDNVDLDEVFRRFNAEMFGFGHENGPAGPTKPSAIRINIKTSLKDLYYGVKKHVKYKVSRICPDCDGLRYIKSEGGYEEECHVCKGSGKIIHNNGNGMITFLMCQACNGTGSHITNGCKKCNSSGVVTVDEEIEFDIPAGMPSNSQFIAENKGNEAYIRTKKVKGDVIVQISETDSGEFIRENENLHKIIEVPVIDCVIGEEINVVSIDGATNKFKLKTGTQAGEKYKLNGLGMPIMNTKQRGDLYVHIKHVMPSSLDEHEINLLKEFKKYNDKK